MIKKTILVAVALAAISSIASAEDKAPTAPAAKPAAAKADAAPKADAPKADAATTPPMGAPTPPAENDMFKKVAGTWRCDSISTGPDGKDMKVKTTWTWKNVLGGQWYTVVYKRAKTGPVPAFEGNATMGYNGAEKKYVFVGFDNMGGWINLSSADGMSYAGDGLPMGKKGTIKIAFAKGKDKKGEESDKMMNVSLDLGGHPVSETCKK
jgi:Protein of unknown function (DUF1579)